MPKYRLRYTVCNDSMRLGSNIGQDVHRVTISINGLMASNVGKPCKASIHRHATHGHPQERLRTRPPHPFSISSHPLPPPTLLSYSPQPSFLAKLPAKMAARQAQPPRRYEAGTADAGGSPGAPGGPPHVASNRVEDLEKKELKEVE